MYMSYYGSFVLQCYVLRMRVMTSTVGGNLTSRPPTLRHIHVKKKKKAKSWYEVNHAVASTSQIYMKFPFLNF